MKKTQIVSSFVGGALAVVVVSATIIGFLTNDKKIVPTTTTITTTTQPVSETTTEITTIPPVVTTTAPAPTTKVEVTATEVATTAPTTQGAKYATMEQYNKIQKGVTTYEEACAIFGFEGEELRSNPKLNLVEYTWATEWNTRVRVTFIDNVVGTGMFDKLVND